MDIRKLLIAIMALGLFTAPVHAWDNNITHPSLTNRAVDYLVASNPSLVYLANYAHFSLSSDSQLTCMDEGSVKEDYAVSADWNTGVWGSQQDSEVPALSWKSHGYNPKTNETWYNIPDFANAYVYSGDIWTDINTRWNPYFQVGRFCHLIEDMASPPHAHGDYHGSGDDLEEYSKARYSTISFTVSKAKKPSIDGLAAQTGLPHPAMKTDNSGNFIRNVVWQTYYMTSYWGSTLVKREGNYQPDSELKRMFPYNSGTGLRYDDGGWFVNDSYVINAMGNNWIGVGIGSNSDWWDCPSDAQYFYLENIDGDPDSSDPSAAGLGVTPAVFKVNKFKRVRPGDSLSTVLAPNTKIFGKIYCENLYKLSSEWAAGFITYSEAVGTY